MVLIEKMYSDEKCSVDENRNTKRIVEVVHEEKNLPHKNESIPFVT